MLPSSSSVACKILMELLVSLSFLVSLCVCVFAIGGSLLPFDINVPPKDTITYTLPQQPVVEFDLISTQPVNFIITKSTRDSSPSSSGPDHIASCKNSLECIKFLPPTQDGNTSYELCIDNPTTKPTHITGMEAQRD